MSTFRRLKHTAKLVPGLNRLATVRYHVRRALPVLKGGSRARVVMYQLAPVLAFGIVRLTLSDGTPVRMRWRTSDRWVFDQVFVERQYDLPYACTDPKVIVDAGANIGLSSLFFASKFPNARIVAIEPDNSNFELLTTNTADNPNITRVKASLWHQNAAVALHDPGIGPWGIQTRPAKRGEATVATITMDQLLAQHGHIDLLKLDIEGAERDVLKHSSTWIGHVQAIAVELHPANNPDVQTVFAAATVDFPLSAFHREVTFASR